VTHSAIELRKSRIHALDGDIGHVSDIYFDDSSWNVRYFVVDTRNWLPGRKVLIAPHAVDWSQSQRGKVALNLTKDQIRHAPGIDEDRPVSLQHQAELASYYAWPLPYEGMAPITAGLPATPLPEPAVRQPPPEEKGDPHLRSLSEVLGYRVAAGEHEVGSVADLQLDEQLRVAAVILRDRTAVTPAAITEIDWATQTVRVTRQ
jgi:hypothetical protein